MKTTRILALAMLFGLAVSALQAQYDPSVVRGDEVPDFTAADTLGRQQRLSDLRGTWLVLDFWASWCGDCRKEFAAMKQLYDDYACCDACTDSASAAANGCKCRDASASRSHHRCVCASTGLTFVGISMDHDADAWRHCLRKEQFGWLQLSNLTPWKENPIATAYGLKWIPTLILVDPNGRVVGTAFTADEMRQLLEETKEMLRLRDEE